jgi:aspartate aminotransferase-like enzyme
MEWPYRLLAPGPVPMPPQVYDALSEPIIHHRTPEFEIILRRVLDRLPLLFETKNPVLMQACVGSGAMESAIVNTLSPGDSVICVNAGKFGERWLKMTKAFSLVPIGIEVPWGEAVDPEQIRSAIQKNPKAKAVLVQVSETSTGAIHPIKEIAQITKNTSALLMVDAITALGVTKLSMDEWGIDVVVAGSQKAFMLPPGLGFLALSDKAWAAQAQSKMPRYYWDLALEKKANETNQTRFTSMVSHVKALDKVLDLLFEIGIDNYQTYVASLGKALVAAGKTLGFTVYPQSPSPALTTLNVPNGIDGKKLRAHLESKYNITIAGGQDQLAGKIIRIGHMGYIKKSDILAFVSALSMSLQDLGAKSDSKAALIAAETELQIAVFK